MKKVRVGALIGLFAVVLVAVGVMVWPTPKEAMADEHNHIIIVRNNGVPTPWVMVEFRTYQGGQWVMEPTLTDLNGRAEQFGDTYATYWQARVDDEDWIPNLVGWQNIIYPDVDIEFNVQ